MRKDCRASVQRNEYIVPISFKRHLPIYLQLTILNPQFSINVDGIQTCQRQMVAI
jgi:hypothetical protein